MTRVLECSSDGLDDTRLDIGRWVVQVEVLSAYSHQLKPTAAMGVQVLTSLSDDSGVSSVLVKVLSNLAPKTLEHLGASGKVKTGEISVVDTLLNNLWWVSRNKLDNRRR